MAEKPMPASPEPQPVKEPESTVKPVKEPEQPDPTRFGDWEKNGRCIDF